MDFLGILSETFARSGFANLSWQQGVMLLISFVLLYCAIVKGFEPLLLLPIAFGMMLANLPDTGIMTDATEAATLAVKNASAALAADPTNPTLVSELAAAQSQLANVHWYDSGVLRIIHRGVKSSIFPCLIFMGVGAMTDFGPLLANPISLLLGAAAQLGIYIAFIFAMPSPSAASTCSLLLRLLPSVSSAARMVLPLSLLPISWLPSCSLPSQ